MSKTGRPNYRRKDRERNRGFKSEKRIIVDAVQRQRPDLRKLSRAMIAMGMDVQANVEGANTKQANAGADAASAVTNESDRKEADHDGK